MLLWVPDGTTTLVHEPIGRVPSHFAARDLCLTLGGTLSHGPEKSRFLQLNSNPLAGLPEHLCNLVIGVPALEEFDGFSQFPAFLGNANCK